MVPVVLAILVVFQVPGPEIRILREISSPEPRQNHPGTVSTKTHSGGSDGTGGFDGFLGSRRSLAGFKSSGRSVGKISTRRRRPKLPWSRVMTKKPKPTRGILMVLVVLVVSWVLGGSWP